jgi:hypothetical protein
MFKVGDWVCLNSCRFGKVYSIRAVIEKVISSEFVSIKWESGRDSVTHVAYLLKV